MNLKVVGLVAGLAMTAGISSIATAQDAEETAAGEACELHVYPTLEGQAQTTGLLGGGFIDEAIHRDQNVSDAEYLRDALGPRFQVEAFQTIDVAGALGLPAGTEVIYQTPIADRDITTKVKTRLSDSDASCYAELIVTQNMYLKRAIYGRSLNNRFIFKDFRNGEDEAKLVKGRGGNGLSVFPPDTADQREAADADLRQAFLANFHEYAARFE